MLSTVVAGIVRDPKLDKVHFHNLGHAVGFPYYFKNILEFLNVLQIPVKINPTARNKAGHSPGVAA